MNKMDIHVRHIQEARRRKLEEKVGRRRSSFSLILLIFSFSLFLTFSFSSLLSLLSLLLLFFHPPHSTIQFQRHTCRQYDRHTVLFSILLLFLFERKTFRKREKKKRKGFVRRREENEYCCEVQSSVESKSGSGLDSYKCCLKT